MQVLILIEVQKIIIKEKQSAERNIKQKDKSYYLLQRDSDLLAGSDNGSFCDL